MIIPVLHIQQMIPDHLIFTTTNPCLPFPSCHHCRRKTVNPPDHLLAAYPAVVKKDTQLFPLLVLIICHILPSHINPNSLIPGTIGTPTITTVFTKTILILEEVALSAPQNPGRMTMMLPPPHQAVTQSIQKSWTRISTSDVPMTLLCRSGILYPDIGIYSAIKLYCEVFCTEFTHILIILSRV